MGNSLSPNYKFFRSHFSELASRYGGRIVMIAHGRVQGDCARGQGKALAKMLGEMRRSDPREVPLVTPVPTLKELSSPLLL